MRIWDIQPKDLCRQHLLGEHRELHGLWNILVFNKKGYRQHPETRRWAGRRKALYERHEALVKELQNRNYQHHSPLDKKSAVGMARQDRFVNGIKEQKAVLKAKPCACFCG